KRSIEGAFEDTGYFRAKELIPGEPSDVYSVKLSDSKKGVVDLEKVAGRWQYVQPSYGEASLDSMWLQNLDRLRADYNSADDNDFVQDGVTDLASVPQLKDVPKEPYLRIEVGHGEDAKTRTKTALVVLTGKKLPGKEKKEDKRPLMPKEDRGEKYYAYVE